MRLQISMPAGRTIRRLYGYWVVESVGHIRRGGLRELIRQRGWRFVIIVVAYYTIRDTLLYIVFPLLIARGIL